MTDKNKLGGTTAPASGAQQTTIDSSTTTINPGTTINNRVEPDGTPHTSETAKTEQPKA